MSIIVLFSGSYCSGDEVASRVAADLGYSRMERGIVEAASRASGFTPEILLASLGGPPSFMERFRKDRPAQAAALRLALAEKALDDNILIYGPLGLLLPKGMTHVLRVCLIASHEHRVKEAVRVDSVTERDAQKRIQEYDSFHAFWFRKSFSRDPYDESLYDILIPMHEYTPPRAAAWIAENARKDAVQPNSETPVLTQGFLLASQVYGVLVRRGYDVDVEAGRGEVKVGLNRYTNRLESTLKKIETIVGEIPGVEKVTCGPGTGFVPPSLVPLPELEMPAKVLLVDDEREFVETLSERLQTRNLDSSIVYDGEEALKYIDRDEPEVMVLDLKMPGIDGIEVLRRVKRDHPRIEVIILTGHGSEKEQATAFELGAFAYLNKPVNIDVLTRTLKEAYAKIGRA